MEQAKHHKVIGAFDISLPDNCPCAKVISADRMLDVLKENFEGYETERALMLNADKFGNDLEEVDDMMKKVHEMVCMKMLAISGKYYGLDCFGMVNINNRDNTT